MWVFCLLFLCSCVGGSFRSGVQPPTGTGATGSGSAQSVAARGRLWRFEGDVGFLFVVSLLLRGWIVPVGGSTPDRLRGGRLRIGSVGCGRGGLWRFEGDAEFLLVVPLLLRGWIVPVGGSTPDRHRSLNDAGFV